jgi:cytochrome c oxidase subunit 4
MGLLALTVGSSFFALPGWNSTINLVIAGIKAALVAWFFMRLRRSTPLLRFAAAAGVVWVMLLIGLSFSDLLFRSP